MYKASQRLANPNTITTKKKKRVRNVKTDESDKEAWFSRENLENQKKKNCINLTL